MARRTKVDYGDFESISRSEADECVQRAGVLPEKVDPLRLRLAAKL